tara:strand:+ start:52 stop:1056 length:1005 start_codon:yes stop_codon:yes gene_type:complete
MTNQYFKMNTNKINSPVLLKTAVLFLVFNRPDTTIQVFEKIRQAKPLRLYVASDGPRQGLEGEKEKVTKAREIANMVDWPCNVKTLFRDNNLGCKKAVSEAITWFFEYEEQGIILEDDCVPNLVFFSFCENLLDRYSKDEKVSAISGNNFQNNKWRGEGSYYFSKYPHCWGWATWRRSWKNYNGGITFWSKWRNSHIWLDYMSDKIEQRYWKKIFDRVYANEINSWAYPWTASVWYKGGLSAIPNINLVSNIGFTDDATHTNFKNSKLSKITVGELDHIIHPKKVKINIEADRFTFYNTFGGKYFHFPYKWFVVPYLKLRYIFCNLKSIIRKIF